MIQRYDLAQVTPRRGQTGTAIDGQLIYGPMEAGFTADQLANVGRNNPTCTTANFSAPGGLDTLIAEEAINFACNWTWSILDQCGGHAMTCTSDCWSPCHILCYFHRNLQVCFELLHNFRICADTSTLSIIIL